MLAGMRLGAVDAAVLLHSLPEAQRDDHDIVLAALQIFPKALDCASRRLRDNADLRKAFAAADNKLKLQRSSSALNLTATSASTSASLSVLSGICASASSLSVGTRFEPAASEWGSFSEKK